MSNILLIDDLRIFKPGIVPTGTNLYVCRNSQEALDVLESKTWEWDQIWFDHDLGVANEVVDDTMVVANYIAHRSSEDNPVRFNQIIIHSANNVGATYIARVFDSIGVKAIKVDASQYFTA